MRHNEPFTIATHADLIDRLNDASIGIKIHYFDLLKSNPENVEKLRKHSYKPTWQEVEGLIMEAIQALNGIRHDPRKY